jgi:hypothetical protein
MSKFPTAFALFCIGLCVGYGIGWYVHEGSRPEAYGVALIVGILFAIGSSWPIKFWMNWLASEDENIKVRLEEEERILRRQEREAKLENLKNLKPRITKKNGNSFNEEDFDETSKGIILKFVREARKSGTKVTGQGLVGGILKSIH